MFFSKKSKLSRVIIYSSIILVLLTGVLGGLMIFYPSLKELLTGTKPSPFVTASGTNLYLNGKFYQFTGINAFNLGTLVGINAGCGSQIDDVDLLFSQFRPNTVVRMWAFQGGMATNVTTKQLDWRGLDRIVNAAQQKGIKLVLTLGDQAGTCDDGHWKDRSWYQNGYKSSINDLQMADLPPVKDQGINPDIPA